MPKFIEEIIENHFWNEIPFEIPDFPSGSEEEPEVTNQENNWHKSEAEIREDGHVW